MKVDLRSSALMVCGLVRKKEEMRPLGVRLAATMGLRCVCACEARVKSLGAIESESSRKSSKDNFTENSLMILIR